MDPLKQVFNLFNTLQDRSNSQDSTGTDRCAYSQKDMYV